MSRVKVEAVLSFNSVRKGDVAWTDLTAEIDNHVHAGYLKVIDVEEEKEVPDGESELGLPGHSESGE